MSSDVVSRRKAPDALEHKSLAGHDEDRGVSPPIVVGGIFVAVFLLSMSTALHSSAVALRSAIEGFGEVLIGVTQASFYFGFLLGCVVSPVLTANVGNVRAYAGFAGIASAAILAHLLVVNPPAWIFFRLLQGLCIASMLVVAESRLNTTTLQMKRGTVIAVYGVVYLIAMGAGQPLLGVFSAAGFRLFVVVSILVLLSMIPPTLTWNGHRHATVLQPIHMREAVAASPFAAIGLFAGGVIGSALWSFGPLYADGIGMGDSAIGLFMAAVAAGAVVCAFPLGLASDYFDRRKVVVFATIIATVASGILLFGAQLDPRYLIALAAIVGAFTMPVYSLSFAHVIDQVENNEIERTASAFVALYVTGAIVGTLAAGLLVAGMGITGVFTLLIVGNLVFLAITVRRISRVPYLHLRAKKRFGLYPRTTATAFLLLKGPLQSVSDGNTAAGQQTTDPQSNAGQAERTESREHQTERQEGQPDVNTPTAPANQNPAPGVPEHYGHYPLYRHPDFMPGKRRRA